jgi:hypothetical protein
VYEELMDIGLKLIMRSTAVDTLSGHLDIDMQNKQNLVLDWWLANRQ